MERYFLVVDMVLTVRCLIRLPRYPGAAIETELGKAKLRLVVLFEAAKYVILALLCWNSGLGTVSEWQNCSGYGEISHYLLTVGKDWAATIYWPQY